MENLNTNTNGHPPLIEPPITQGTAILDLVYQRLLEVR